MLADAENLGKVESEHVSEETLTGDQPGKDPNSRIELMIMEEEADSRLGGILLLSIGGPLVVLALVYGAFRPGQGAQARDGGRLGVQDREPSLEALRYSTIQASGARV